MREVGGGGTQGLYYFAPSVRVNSMSGSRESSHDNITGKQMQVYYCG